MTTSNIEFELQLLGLLLKDPKHINSREALDTLNKFDFCRNDHAAIFQTIKNMSEASSDIDYNLVADVMQRDNLPLEGSIYLIELVRGAISIGAMSSYVKGIKKASLIRELLSFSHTTTEMINSNAEPEDIISFINESIKDVESNDNGRELKHIKEIEGDFLDELQARADRGGAIAGLSTGIDELDEALNGVDDESLVVVAGSPSMGKTLFCQTLASNIAVDQGKNIMFFSMEMSEHQVYERFISGLGNIDPSKLKNARLDTIEFARIQEAIHHLRTSGIHITGEAMQSVGQIRAKVRRHIIKNPDLKAIFIDYLGLMKLGKADRHDIAIGNITRDLKELAKEVKVPVFLCVQAKRPHKATDRPGMASLKDSSCIEVDAEVVLFVHRQEIVELETLLKGVTELIIAIERHNDGN